MIPTRLSRMMDDTESNRGVSPVVAVLLLTSITLILAASVGPFILGLTDNVSDEPQMSVSFVYDSPASSYSGPSSGTGPCQDNIAGNSNEHELEVSVVSGEPLDASNVVIIGHSGSRVPFHECSSDVAMSDNLEPGDTAYVGLTESDTVRVVWTADNGDSSSTINLWELPET